MVDPRQLTGNVVGAQNADLGSSGHLSREDTSEGEETTRVGRGNHLGDIQHQRAVNVAVTDGGRVHVVERALIQGVHAVLLGLGGGRQMVHNHLKQRDVGWQPVLHHALHQRLSDELLVLGLELVQHIELLKHGEELCLVVIHGQLDDLADGLVAELAEAALAGLGIGLGGGPLLGGGIEEVVTPQLGDHLGLVGTELGGVHLGEGGQRESPSVEAGREGDGALVGVDL